MSAVKRSRAVLGALSLASLGLASCPSRPAPAPPPAAPPDAAAPARPGAGASPFPELLLRDFRPRSMLHVTETSVPRARFPAVDFHNHTNDRIPADGKPAFALAELLAIMDGANVRTLVILTGRRGEELQRVIDAVVKPHPGRFVVFTQIDWKRIDEPRFGEGQAAELRDSVRRGARGLKVLKELGLTVRDKTGKLVRVDDERLDPIWRECGRLGIPVAIHTADPEAFFHPVDAQNERYEELQRHPSWSFVGKDHPSLEQLLEARDRVIARHPDTIWVALHVGGWPENLDYVSKLLHRFPNVYVELGARQAELGRQPRRARKLFLDHPGRILFGTDARPSPELFASYFRWLESADEHFDYHRAPGQGRWKIYGLELPPEVLRRVYHANADAIFARFKNRPAE
jgi:predicted TIM-barrel fold metal-dependent hydrolase